MHVLQKHFYTTGFGLSARHCIVLMKMRQTFALVSVCVHLSSSLTFAQMTFSFQVSSLWLLTLVIPYISMEAVTSKATKKEPVTTSSLWLQLAYPRKYVLIT